MLPRVPAEPIEPDLEAWDAWDPATLTRLLDGVDVRWYVVGGWALDLFRGGQTREHGDLEIALPQAGFDVVRERLGAFDFYVAGREELWPLDDAGDAFFDYHQTWVREPATGKWRVDVMRDPHDGDTWICRRDRRIRRPYDEVVAHTRDGIPYLRPELVLLFKAKNRRPKDEADFVGVAPLLGEERRRWLAGALAQVYGDGHGWIRELDHTDEATRWR